MSAIAALFIAAEWIAGAYVPPAESDTAAFFAPARNDIVERTFRTRDAAVTSAVRLTEATRDSVSTEHPPRYLISLGVMSL